MRVIIEAINSPSLYKELGSTATLRVEAIKGFTTSDGQIIPPSDGNKLYLEVPITITASEMLIPSFEIDSTEDAMPWDSAVLGDVPGYRFTIVTSQRKLIPYFPQCKIPALTGQDTSFNWGELRIYNRNFHRRFTQLDRLVNVDQVLTWIQDALGSRGKASETNLGLTYLTEDPADPIFPKAVSDSDLRMVQLARVGEMFINIRDHSILPDQNNAVAMQAFLNRFGFNGDLKGGRIVAPSGNYNIETGLTYQGDFGHSFVFQGATQGESANGDGPWLRYTGAVGGTLLTLKGANYVRFEDLGFNGNGLALKCVSTQFDVPRNMSSFDCEFAHCSFGGCVGVDSTLLEVGTTNAASAEHKIVDCRFIYFGNPGDTYYGVRNGGSANAKNYTIEGGGFIGLRWALDLGNSGFHHVHAASFANQTEGDVKNPSAQTALISCGSEGSKRFIDARGISSGLGGLRIESCYFAGYGDENGYVVIFPGTLMVTNSEFHAGNPGGSIPPKFKVGFGDVGGGVFSQGNYYNWNAVTNDDHIPFYDFSDRHIGSLVVGSVSQAHAALFSHSDKIRPGFGDPVVTFPTWMPHLGIGGRNKSVLAAEWAGLGGQYFPKYGDAMILAEGAAGPFGTGFNVVSLPSPASSKGRRFFIVKSNVSAQPVCASAGFTPNFQDGLDRVLLTDKDDHVELESDGTIYRILSSRVGGATTSARSMTTAERDALTPRDSLFIYNTTTNKFQGRAGGAWVDLH